MKYVSGTDWNYNSSQSQLGIAADGENFYVQNAAQPWSISEPAADTFRFEVRSNDHWSYDPTTKDRSELADQNLIANGTPINVSYGFELEPGATNTAAWCVIGQFHQNDYVGENGYSPPFSIGLVGDKMAIAINYTQADGTVAYKYLYTDAVNIVRGHEYAMDIQVTFDNAGKGHLVVTRDGETLVNYTGPLGVPGQTSVYWKEGIYRADARETLAADYSNLSISTGAAATLAASMSNTTSTTMLADGSKMMVTTSGTDKITSVVSTSGALIKQTIQHGNGSRDVTAAVTGQAYTSEHMTLTADGTIVEDDRSNAAGTVIYKVIVGANNTTTDTFSSTGAKLTDTIVNADGSKDITNYSITGQAYTSEHMTVSAGGKIVEDDRSNAADGSTNTTFYAANASKIFTGANEKITTFGGNTMNFIAAAFHDTIQGFHAGDGAGHDTIVLSKALVADFSHLSLAMAGHPNLITLDAQHSIALTNPIGTLTASDFRFV